MAERTSTIASFKYGLDTRRENLASTPGTLAALINGHINSGGECEKRKALIASANAQGAYIKFPSNTFGIQDTDSGIMCFGSDASPNGALPPQVVYQRLLSPSNSSMTGVVSSCNYQGKAFVIAQFADGSTVMYYNGNQILSSRIGKPLPNELSYSLQALNLVAAINAALASSGWIATPNVDANGAALSGSVIVQSPAGIAFTPVVNVVSSNGSQIFTAPINDTTTAKAGTPEVRAIAGFQVTGFGNGTVVLVAPANIGGSPTVQITGGVLTITGAANAAAVATTIVNAVNANTITTGYTAQLDTTAGDVWILAPSGWGANPNGFTLATTTTGGVTVGATVGSLTLSAYISVSTSTNVSSITLTFPTAVPFPFSIPATVVATGGFLPPGGSYSYAWSELPPGGSGMTILNPHSATATFSFIAPAPVNTLKGVFQCIVSDSSTPMAQSVTLPFTLIFNSIH